MDAANWEGKVRVVVYKLRRNKIDSGGPQVFPL